MAALHATRAGRGAQLLRVAALLAGSQNFARPAGDAAPIVLRMACTGRLLWRAHQNTALRGQGQVAIAATASYGASARVQSHHVGCRLEVLANTAGVRLDESTAWRGLRAIVSTRVG